MWPEIYNFFEQYAGVSYNFVEDINDISGDFAFIEPYAWQSGINNILENLQDALDCINEYGQYLGEDMPSKDDLKKIVASYVLGALIKNLNDIKRTLNIDPVDINNYEDLEKQLYLVGKLVELLVTHPLDEILAEDLFNTYIVEEEDDDNEFVTLLGLHENDVPNLSFTVTSLREDYFASLDEDEE